MAPYLFDDGTTIEIRPIRQDDSDRLQAAHARLSPESRYRRFLGAKPVLSTGDVHYLVDIDGADHFALVGVVHEGDDEAIVAVARFVRLHDDPGAAEFAIVVGDQYQRRGLAAEMLQRLAAASQERGIERWRATILADNVGILKLIERLADGAISAVRRGSVTEVEFALPSGRDAAVDSRGARRAPARPRTAAVRSSRRALEADRPFRT
jgi:RimJ/RimL family protein N-acetyltransferase